MNSITVDEGLEESQRGPFGQIIDFIKPRRGDSRFAVPYLAHLANLSEKAVYHANPLNLMGWGAFSAGRLTDIILGNYTQFYEKHPTIESAVYIGKTVGGAVLGGYAAKKLWDWGVDVNSGGQTTTEAIKNFVGASYHGLKFGAMGLDLLISNRDRTRKEDAGIFAKTLGSGAYLVQKGIEGTTKTIEQVQNQRKKHEPRLRESASGFWDAIYTKPRERRKKKKEQQKQKRIESTLQDLEQRLNGKIEKGDYESIESLRRESPTMIEEALRRNRLRYSQLEQNEIEIIREAYERRVEEEKAKRLEGALEILEPELSNKLIKRRLENHATIEELQSEYPLMIGEILQANKINYTDLTDEQKEEVDGAVHSSVQSIYSGLTQRLGYDDQEDLGRFENYVATMREFTLITGIDPNIESKDTSDLYAHSSEKGLRPILERLMQREVGSEFNRRDMPRRYSRDKLSEVLTDYILEDDLNKSLTEEELRIYMGEEEETKIEFDDEFALRVDMDKLLLDINVDSHLEIIVEEEVPVDQLEGDDSLSKSDIDISSQLKDYSTYGLFIDGKNENGEDIGAVELSQKIYSGSELKKHWQTLKETYGDFYLVEGGKLNDDENDSDSSN